MGIGGNFVKPGNMRVGVAAKGHGMVGGDVTFNPGARADLAGAKRTSGSLKVLSLRWKYKLLLRDL